MRFRKKDKNIIIYDASPSLKEGNLVNIKDSVAIPANKDKPFYGLCVKIKKEKAFIKYKGYMELKTPDRIEISDNVWIYSEDPDTVRNSTYESENCRKVNVIFREKNRVGFII